MTILAPKTAVQFGAGNIGRGFIGVLLSRAEYAITFVDVVISVVDLINQHQQYTVREISPTTTNEIIVENIAAVDGSVEAEVAQAICHASLITTAVGPNVLKMIAPAIAKGIQQRAEMEVTTPLNVIACENVIGNSTILQKHVLEHLPASYHPYTATYVGFPCCVVDKMVTNLSEAQRKEDPLLVIAEGRGSVNC